jgi:hypothetical protein
MEHRSGTTIFPNRVALDQSYIDEKGGILNALTFASAQYVYKVLEKHNGDSITRFDSAKAKKLKRTIIHKNAHLDEYFAELIFRAILPPYLKDVEVCEHVLMSKEDDTYAKVSWPNGVVFGIHADEAGGAKALAFYDEHHSDGSRIKPSCSQLVAEEYLGNVIPQSVQKVLDEVNYSDSHSGAHQFNIKNLFFAMHDILYVVGKDEIDDHSITKYLTENWKRAIVDSCLTAMIFVYENRLLPVEFDDSSKESIERVTKKSLDYFLSKSILSASSPEYFEQVKKNLLRMFKVWRKEESGDNNYHKTIDGAVWRDDDGKIIKPQILILQNVCFALNKCWGENIANFVMMHIWQILFQQQVAFQEVKNEIIKITESEGKGITKFGYIERTLISNLNFVPHQSIKDRRKRNLNINSPLWVYEVSVTNPNYPNVKTVLGSIINDDYPQKGNNGFGLFILHDKTINSKIVNNGQTIPDTIWVKLSDKILRQEPDCWFQLKSAEGGYADFILNRNKAHQEHFPSTLIDKDFIINAVKEV